SIVFQILFEIVVFIIFTFIQLFSTIMMANRTIALSKFAKSAVSTVPQIQVAAYHKNVIDHYENPRNVGSLDKNDPSVGTGVVGAPACGDVMKLQIKVIYIKFYIKLSIYILG